MLRHALAAAALALVIAAPAQAQTFDFTGAPPGAATPLVQTSSGLTATFTSSPAGAFVVRSSTTGGPAFVGLTGNYLYAPNYPATPLLVAFSQPLSSLFLNFVTAGGNPASGGVGPVPITLQAFFGTTLVGSITTLGVAPPGFFNPEGTLAFAAAAFDNVRISSVNVFGVDNLRATQASVVPEPATVALVGAGLAGLGVAARRRRVAA